MSRAEQAKEYFKQGYNCAQATLLAFSDITGMDTETAMKVALSFGGGMGRMRLTCGAVSGMCMAAGVILGSACPTQEAKSKQYAIVQQLANKFKEKEGSVICGELLTGSGVKTNTSPTAEERTQTYYKKRPCAEYVFDAVQILEEYLNENK